MRKVVASEIVSLDGVAQSPENWSFPFQNDQMEEALGEAMEASDAMLLGRVTYEGFAAFWPSQGEDTGFAGYMNDTPKHVVSTTLQEPLGVAKLDADQGRCQRRDRRAKTPARQGHLDHRQYYPCPVVA
jgi:dihydrofolate reductase